MATRQTMVVLRALGLGDFLTAVPALRALRRARPDHLLVLAAPTSIAPLAELSDAVDLIHPTQSLAELIAPRRSVDIAVNLHGKGPESHQALIRTMPREFLAFGCPSLAYAGPAWRAGEHEVHRWCRLVAEGWAAEVDPSDLRLRRPARDAAVPGAVVVHAGAAFAARRWPVDRYAEVARGLQRRGHRVVLTGSGAEAPLAEELRDRAGLPRDAVLAGRTDLAALAALVAQARLVVSGDTGVAHLASAYGAPSVVLFGPTPPSRWGPPPDGPHVALWRGTKVGDPWGDQPDPALLEIGVDAVLAHADALLGTGDAAVAPDSTAGRRHHRRS